MMQKQSKTRVAVASYRLHQRNIWMWKIWVQEPRKQRWLRSWWWAPWPVKSCETWLLVRRVIDLYFLLLHLSSMCAGVYILLLLSYRRSQPLWYDIIDHLLWYLKACRLDVLIPSINMWISSQAYKFAPFSSPSDVSILVLIYWSNKYIKSPPPNLLFWVAKKLIILFSLQ